jgi:hypothetical protein
MTSEIIITILVGITCGSLGFGVSQLLIVGEVKSTSRDVENLKEDFHAEQKRTDERIFAITGLVGNAIEECRELITLLRVRQR